MFRYAAISASTLLFAYSSVVGSAAAQQTSNTAPQDQDIIAVSMQAEVMPPTLEVADPPTSSDTDTSPVLLNTPNNTSSIDERPVESSTSTANVEMRLVTRGIYQCQDGNRSVFVDEENRVKYRQCTQIRAPYYEQVITDNPADSERAPCSGAIVYKGGTYVFNDHEPCPIPEEIFEARKPIEANPEYYSQPTS